MNFVIDAWTWLVNQQLPVVEWWATGLALVYVVLAARNTPWCWPFAFVSSVLWAYQVFSAYDLVFDTGLNAFYAVMALLGLYRWWQGDEKENLPIRKMPWSLHGKVIGGGLLVTVLLVVLAKAFTEAALPGLDALTTVFSVLGTFLLISRFVENWLYLFVMDVIYVYIYVDRGSILFAGLFVLYCILAVYGYWSWLCIMRQKELAVPKNGQEFVDSV